MRTLKEVNAHYWLKGQSCPVEFVEADLDTTPSTWWAEVGCDAFNAVEQHPADVMVWDCTGHTEDGSVFRHIQIQAISEGRYDTGDMACNTLATACALPAFNHHMGWHYGWVTPLGQCCRLNDKPSQYIGYAYPIMSYEHDQLEYQAYSEMWGYCSLSDRPSPIYQPITHDEAVGLGYSFRYSGGLCYTSRPDGTEFITATKSIALKCIANGSHLEWYDIPPQCPVRIVNESEVYSDTYRDMLAVISTEEWCNDLGMPMAPGYMSHEEWERDRHLMEF